MDFARNHRLGLVVKGRVHSYIGVSNAPDSLLIWTRCMTELRLHEAFVPQARNGRIAPQPAVTMDAGRYWGEAYRAVTTQGGGCTTVGVAGLILGGGFGSFSKCYGTAAGSLLEAEVVTADRKIRTVNACTHPDLFWALKGGGGGTFAAVTKVTVRTHELPEYFGVVSFKLWAPSDEASRELLCEFVGFYAAHLFNEHWGEQAHVRSDNVLQIMMLSQRLTAEQSRSVWQPFLDWVKHSPLDYAMDGRVVNRTVPARHMWDPDWLGEHWSELVYPRNGNPLHALLDDVLAYTQHFHRDK